MLIARYAGRKSVHARRRHGRWTSAILAVGTSESVGHLAEVMARNHEAGLVVVGACVEDAEIGDLVAPRVPVVGDLNHAAAMAAQLGVDIVAVAGSGLGPRRIRELGWELEGTGRNMVMAPGLTEVAGPRVHVSPVEGLPLMWVDQPQFTGVRWLVKRCVDVVGATAALAVFAPLLVFVARTRASHQPRSRAVPQRADGPGRPRVPGVEVPVDVSRRRPASRRTDGTQRVRRRHACSRCAAIPG